MMDLILVDKHVDGEVLRPFMNNCTAIDLILKWNIYCFYFLPLFDKIEDKSFAIYLMKKSKHQQEHWYQSNRNIQSIIYSLSFFWCLYWFNLSTLSLIASFSLYFMYLQSSLTIMEPHVSNWGCVFAQYMKVTVHS